MTEAYKKLVDELAVPHRAKQAYAMLIAAGPHAKADVRAGLRHANAHVRRYCCQYFDFFVDGESLDELISMLDDDDADVRVHALHSLACDRCKTDACRPDEALVLPRAIALLRHDPDQHIRQHAVGLVGVSVHRNAEALAAIERAVASDPHPAVRKKARWHAPGGPIFKRTRPKAPRVKRELAGAR